MICPWCGSTDTYPDPHDEGHWECGECGDDFDED